MSTVLLWSCDRCPETVEAPEPRLWWLVGAHYATHPLRMGWDRELACDGRFVPKQREP